MGNFTQSRSIPSLWTRSFDSAHHFVNVKPPTRTWCTPDPGPHRRFFANTKTKYLTHRERGGPPTIANAKNKIRCTSNWCINNENFPDPSIGTHLKLFGHKSNMQINHKMRSGTVGTIKSPIRGSSKSFVSSAESLSEAYLLAPTKSSVCMTFPSICSIFERKEWVQYISLFYCCFNLLDIFIGWRNNITWKSIWGEWVFFFFFGTCSF